MNFSTCASTEEESLNKKITSCVTSLHRQLSNFPKLKNIECHLCTESISLNNVHDLVRIYSCMLYCMKLHCKVLHKLSVYDIFSIETFLLNFILSDDITEIEYLIKYNNNSNEIRYKKALKDQLVAIFRTFFQEKIFNINCEQEIESMLYFYYKKIRDDKKDDYLTNFTLVILFLRKEYIRFNIIFKKFNKNRFTIKLAILFEMTEDNTKEALEKYRLFDKACSVQSLFLSNLRKFLSSTGLKNNYYLESIKKLCETDGDIEQRINIIKNEVNWHNCVVLWANNRCNNSSYVDNSMIDICIKYGKYEDGWKIYNNYNLIETSRFLRGVTLCCIAMKNVKHCKWKKRLVEVIDLIFKNLDLLNLENLLENILINIENLPISQIIAIVNELQKHLIRLSLKESIIECLFNFYNIYCFEYQNQELNKICCTNAIYIYNKWNKSKTKNFNLFRKKTEFDTKIYSHMLGLCDIAKNCEFFSKVCKDLLKNDAHISRDLCRRLENFHSKNCQDCEYKKKQVVTVKESHSFISHLFK